MLITQQINNIHKVNLIYSNSYYELNSLNKEDSAYEAKLLSKAKFTKNVKITK